jgi:hypothetical protein
MKKVFLTALIIAMAGISTNGLVPKQNQAGENATRIGAAISNAFNSIFGPADTSIETDGVNVWREEL